MYNLLQLPMLQVAQDLHLDVMYDYICLKLGNITNEDSKYREMLSGVKTMESTISSIISDFLFEENRLLSLLKGKPDELIRINEEFEDFIINGGFDVIRAIDWENNTQSKEFIRDNFSKNSSGILYDIFEELNKIFNYKAFKAWKPTQIYNSYKLAELLGMRACTYCNRDYILVQKDNKEGKLLCPQYDHWFPRSKFPLLQLSFFNLIPSCGSCNSSVKGDNVLNIDEFYHPYMEWEEDEMFYFTYYLESEKKRYRVKVKSLKENSKLQKTVEELKIDQMYNGHIPELIDIIDLKRAYGENYLRILKNSFPKLGTFTVKEVYRMHFGTEKDDVDFYKKPMSKFKKDILQKLKLIDESY